MSNDSTETLRLREQVEVYYSVKYACVNCGHRFVAEFKKGKGAPSRIPCELCEVVNAARKSMF